MDALAVARTLLTKLAEFDNLHIRTMGFLANEGGAVLFLSRDHAKAYDIASDIPLRVPDEKLESLRNSGCFDKYVYVEGRFAVEHEYVGKTIKVQKISNAFTTKTCWRGD